MNFQYTSDGLHLTEQFEGCKLQAYTDSGGVWTIGYGHTADVSEGDTCTQEEAESFLQQDTQRCVNQINRDVTLATLTQEEFNALVDFGFNLGLHALETSTLWRLLMAGDIDGAAAQFPRWDKCGGVEVAGLLRRRMAEKKEFEA